MTYLIDLFLKLNGVIDAQGEDDDDRWRLIVTRNAVTSLWADEGGA